MTRAPRTQSPRRRQQASRVQEQVCRTPLQACQEPCSAQPERGNVPSRDNRIPSPRPSLARSLNVRGCAARILHSRVIKGSKSATGHLSRGISHNSLAVSPKLPSRNSKRRKAVAHEVYDTPIRPKLVDPPSPTSGASEPGDRSTVGQSPLDDGGFRRRVCRRLLASPTWNIQTGRGFPRPCPVLAVQAHAEPSR